MNIRVNGTVVEIFAGARAADVLRRARRLLDPAFRFVLALPLLIGLAACASLPRVPSETRIVIFHLNDVHGKIDNFAKIAAIVAAERRTDAEVFLLSAGDNFTGNPIIDQYDPPGEPVLELFNHLGLDLMCLGNHEFDPGLANLDRFAARARFPIVTANLQPPAGTLSRLSPHAILRTRSGVKLAVFGLIQIEPGNGLPSTHPDRVRGLRFSEPLARALELKNLRAEGQVFVGLTHLGYEDDLRLAQQMPELDVIVGGHSHTRVDPAETVNGVLVAQAGSDARFLGRIELRVRRGRVVEKSGRLIDLTGTLAEDPEVKGMIARFNQNPALARVLVETPVELEGKDALGSLMTDALRQAHGLDIAFQNDGGIRLPRLPRRITLKDAYTLDPFGNQVVEMAMTAAEIRGLIHDSFRKGREIDLQVSGISYVVRTAGPDRQVTDILLRDAGGQPLPEGKPFRVGVSSYIASAYDFPHADPGHALGSTTVAALIQFLEGKPDLSVYQGIRRAFQEPAGENTH